MAWGFFYVGLSSMMGVFNSFDLTDAFVKDPNLRFGWEATLMNSAHGHSSLFGFLHIFFGLTIPYSPLDGKIKQLQTAGFALGCLGMGPLMIARGILGPAPSFSWLGIAIGACLSGCLVAILSHSFGLLLKFIKR